MNNHEEEKKKLFEWSAQQLSAIDKKYPYKRGDLDGQGIIEQKEHIQEFNKRLLRLNSRD